MVYDEEDRLDIVRDAMNHRPGLFSGATLRDRVQFALDLSDQGWVELVRSAVAVPIAVGFTWFLFSKVIGEASPNMADIPYVMMVLAATVGWYVAAISVTGMSEARHFRHRPSVILGYAKQLGVRVPSTRAIHSCLLNGGQDGQCRNLFSIKEKRLREQIESRLRRSGIFDLDASEARMVHIRETMSAQSLSWDQAAAIVDNEPNKRG